MNRRAAFLFAALVMVTYRQDVKPILDAHCIECHTFGADLDLSRFPFQGSGDQNAIVGRMLTKLSATPPSMPPGHRPKLASAELATLRAWKEGGLKN